MPAKDFKSGFVTIMGRPNVGKSTLMNALTRINLAITSPKAQTTRHRIFGIITEDDYQIVYSDTPGMIDPQYKLQEQMMNYVNAALNDANLILYLDYTEGKNNFQLSHHFGRVVTVIMSSAKKISKVLSSRSSVSKKLSRLPL